MSEPIRLGIRMQLHPGNAAEYARRHDNLWPEMADLLRDHGVSDYVIYLDESDGSLFASLAVADLERWEAIANSPVCQRWWQYMAPLMEVGEGVRPRSTGLAPVFQFR